MVVALCNVHSSIIALTLLLKETVICNIGDPRSEWFEANVGALYCA